MIGALLEDRYRIDSELGSGGMGEVFRAHDMFLERDVALKVVSGSEMSVADRTRLLNEARVAANLNHPNIVSIFDAGETELPEEAGIVPFIVMELIEGESIFERKPQEFPEILNVTRQICAALEHAHSQGVIHRDLKPENVLLTVDGTAKLTDFGLARRGASRLTDEGAMVGTVYYLAPELAQGGDIDGRVDLYALGVLLYELTTGELPFTADDPVAVIYQHLNAPLVPPREKNPDIPPPLETLIVELLSKEPAERPASAARVLDTLAVMGEPPQVAEAPLTRAILMTKLHIPTLRPELVSRPYLIKKLNEGLHRKLTLISAPAGFGKTTLVSDWIANLQLDGEKGGRAVNHTSTNTIKNRVAWLSLDEGDNDLNSFLIYFIAAMQTVEPDIGLEPLAALQSSGTTNSEAVLMALLNEIAGLPRTLILILDDYHMIESQSIDSALTFLLDHLPATMHLVITTRIDPVLPLARLRGRGQLTELRVADLRFSNDEAATFLNQMMRLELSIENVAALRSRTEGWITGLQLAALSLQERDRAQVTSFIQSFTGIHHHVLDYLVEEVLQQQPPRLQSFLLQTSILTRLTDSLCEAVCDFENDSSNQSDGHTILQHLAQSNLFIVPLDDERRWYRYHHLFADLLRYRLQREQAHTIPDLHRRASKWHEEHGFIDRAIRHAIAADDLEQAVRLVDEHSHPANERGEVSTVRGWFELLPDEMVRSDPSLSVACAWNLFLNGQISAVEDRLKDAEILLAKQTTSVKNEQVAELFGKINALRAILFGVQGKPMRGIELAQQLLELISDDNLSARGITLLTLGGLFRDVGDLTQASRSYAEAVTILQASENILASVMAVEQLVWLLVIQGQLVQAAEICQEMLNLLAKTNAQGKQQVLVSDMARAILSTVLYERNELADAEMYVCQGIKQAKRGGFFQSLVFGQILLVRILQARGDADGANKMMQAAMNSTQMNPSQRYQAELTACQVQLWLAQNDLDTAFRWAQESKLSTEVEFNPQNEFEHISLARVLIAQGRAESDGTTLAKALELTKRLTLSAESAGRMGHLIELLILQALALDAEGDLNQALSSLERALGLAEPQGFARIFLDNGDPIIRLLKEAARRDIAVKYVIKLLNLIDRDARPDGPNLSPSSILIDPLSDRELEVLHLMAQDLSYKEMADQIVVSLNTVRTHVKNIYSKLMVHKRSQAVAKARELNLL